MCGGVVGRRVASVLAKDVGGNTPTWMNVRGHHHGRRGAARVRVREGVGSDTVTSRITSVVVVVVMPVVVVVVVAVIVIVVVATTTAVVVVTRARVCGCADAHRRRTTR